MTAAATESDSSAVLDLRTYALVPGGRDEFDRIFREGAFPMLRRAGVQVVCYGPSLVDDRHYFLARAFRSVAERERQLSAFYGSDDWRESFEGTVTGLIETYHVVVVPLATTTVHEALAATPLSAPGAAA
jgi:NIPSNAP